MKTYKVIAAFSDAKRKNDATDSDKYTKVFGPFEERRQAESAVVQLCGQAGCQSAEVVVSE
jgi:hypothetical protein